MNSETSQEIEESCPVVIAPQNIIRKMMTQCVKCEKIYDFARLDKSTDEYKRNYDIGHFCHTCYSEYCNECMKSLPLHSKYDDPGICRFKNCENKGILTCGLCK